jgi:hypothetical protein
MQRCLKSLLFLSFISTVIKPEGSDAGGEARKTSFDWWSKALRDFASVLVGVLARSD